MAPFRGIFPEKPIGDASVFDTSLLFAAIVYLVVALLVDALLRLAGPQGDRRAAVHRGRGAAGRRRSSRRRGGSAALEQAAHRRAVAGEPWNPQAPARHPVRSPSGRGRFPGG